MTAPADQRFFAVFDEAPVRELAAGETLIYEGDPADYVYNSLEGMLMLFRSGSDGRRQVIGYLWPNNFVGLSSLGHYRFSAKAITPVRVAFRRRDALEKLFADDPDAEHQFVNMVFRVLEGVLDLVYTLGQRTSVERIAVFLMFLHNRDQRFGHLLETDDSPDAPVLRLPMTRTDIADFLGLKIETVSRGLRKLSDRSLIELQGSHAVRIVDMAGLETLAGIDDLPLLQA